MAAQAKAVAYEGLLTSSGCRSVDGFHRPVPSFEQIGSYKTVSRFPYGSSFQLGASQPKISPLGSRGLHASQIMSESTKVSNRPLSPHLPLKKPQLSATYSISHRIFGGSVASLILLVPVAMKFSIMYDV